MSFWLAGLLSVLSTTALMGLFSCLGKVTWSEDYGLILFQVIIFFGFFFVIYAFAFRGAL
jgi:hypothetical protein